MNYANQAIYLSKVASYQELADYIIITRAYNFMADVQTFNSILLKRAIKEYMIDCDIRACLLPGIKNGTITFDAVYNSGKSGKPPFQIINDWQIYYNQGKLGQPFNK